MPTPTHISISQPATVNCRCGKDVWAKRSIPVAAALGTVFILLAGCGGNVVSANPSNAQFSISPGAAQIDTNCTGCNAAHSAQQLGNQFTATLAGGGPASVTWLVAGGDPVAGTGKITASGLYTPPTYLTRDQVQVVVTAALRSNPGVRASSVLTVTPGFLQPLTPENLALGPGGTATVTGFLSEARGSAGIRFALKDPGAGDAADMGTLSATSCRRSADAFTSCTVTYTAPATLASTRMVHLQAFAGQAGARIETQVLLNTAGVASDPVTHQSQQFSPMLLGSSGGNNNDFDAQGDTIADCCSGTLGALVEDEHGARYLLSNNHVLARSDHATVGDAIVQPGLIDNNCTPNGDGAGTQPVGTLAAWLPLDENDTNADAAIARVESNSVDPQGRILELGAKLPDGQLAPAPPGVSSTGGLGEAGSLSLPVAKSGRTTGLTCGEVSALSLDIKVNYYRDCAETRPYLTKLFTNQIGISGDQFSDSGDSGALIVDAADAEPVGLYFAGGTDASGVDQGVANPAQDVLSELATHAGNGAAFTFVGGADHPVSCLSFGNSTAASAQARALSAEQIARVQNALEAARTLVNPGSGILGVAMGKSSDDPGTAAVIVYVSEGSHASIPALIRGVRTVMIPTTAGAVALGSAPMANALSAAPALDATTLARAVAVKQRIGRGLMDANSAFFGVGVGQSLDNPAEAALVIYVDRQKLPAQLPAVLDGLRTRYVVMNPMHVTRSYEIPFRSRIHCLPHPRSKDASGTLPDLRRHTLF
ncbi:MAG TPA: hypothetical protein VND90_06670 [Terracidiphilus sp.]|nr:hypothetical protein [Terracidiphilus sp.]